MRDDTFKSDSQKIMIKNKMFGINLQILSTNVEGHKTGLGNAKLVKRSPGNSGLIEGRTIFTHFKLVTVCLLLVALSKVEMIFKTSIVNYSNNMLLY